MTKLSPARLCSALCILATALLGSAGGPRSEMRPVAKQPDVLLITVDTLRADRVSAYGYARATTPHLDRLIADGVRFSEARTVEPLTGPALCSLLTSRYPHEHGASRNGLRLRSGMPSLAKALQAHGYRTAAFVGNWTLRDKLSGLAEHFEMYEEVLTRARWFGLVRRESSAEDINSSFGDWLADHRRRYPDRPFLAWVHYVEPHAPYRAHNEFRQALGLKPRGDLTAEQRYDTEIAYTDAAIGDLLRRVRGDGERDDTLLVFAADHGESLGEHDYWGHGRHLYEPTLRIPMSLTWRGRVRPQTIESPALIIDLAPTILGLIGAPKLEDARGFDWTPVLDGAAAPGDRITHYQAHRGAVISKHDSDLARRSGVLEVGVIHLDRKEIFHVGKQRRWVFDLAEDPLELASLSSPKETPTESLLDWMREVYGGLTSFDDVPPEPLDEESIEQLRSLGYVD